MSENNHRLVSIDNGAWKTDSLVGTYFHGDQNHQWQGVIVVEPQPGWYLVELFDWISGHSECQKLVRIDEMTGWRFYNTVEWMRNAYNDTVQYRWAHPANDSVEQ